jgi:antitoxin component YwqK of YwqJK toxin-antitoxin module
MKTLFLIFLLCVSFSIFSQDVQKIRYYEDGSKKELLSLSEDLVLNGVCYKWSEDGILVGLATYKKGVKHGEWKIWRNDGSLAYEMFYENGKRVGIWIAYSEEGHIVDRINFN